MKRRSSGQGSNHAKALFALFIAAIAAVFCGRAIGRLQDIAVSFIDNLLK